MTDGHIPVNPGDLPIDVPALDESAIYVGSLKKATINPKTDKNGNVFCSIQVEVTDGDFEGAVILHNYIPIPTPEVMRMLDGTKAEQFKAKSLIQTFGRFCRAFKVDSQLPAVETGRLDSYSKWQEAMERHYGKTGKFTVRNQEFPEGSGRVRSGINDFIF